MKKNTFKSILFLVFTLCTFSILAQDAPPSEGIFRLKNVATGKFLTDSGSSATAVTMSDSGDDASTYFTFAKVGSFYNIDSEISGILRAPGAGGPGGAFVIVSTTKAAPASDADKTWTISYNSTNDTYRFQTRTSGRFMYHEEDGTVTHKPVADTDDRSNWELILLVQTPVEVAPDEDTNTDLSCPASGEFQNDNTRNVDINNPDNVGTADDRTCYADYSESNVYDKTWGVYNITDGSNHWDGESLQPRIERSLSRSSGTGIGSFARFKGTVRILEVGDTGVFSQSGTYIAQAKGKHSGTGGSADPAICLYRAHAVYGTGINEGKQIAFDIYAERILERGGEGSRGREVVFLKRVNKDEEFDFELEVGFRRDPNDSTKKIHYCDAVIAGETFAYNIPEPERGLESGIRYGVYRVRGGRAQIRWANTTYEKEEINGSGKTPSADEIYRLRNLATGKFLTVTSSSATPVFMGDSGDTPESHFTFVESGAFFNIDSETLGILRAPGSGSSQGPYVILSTTKRPPAADADKTWTIYHDDLDDTYRFESRIVGRFMYHGENGTVTHENVPETDARSKWEAIPTSVVLSTSDNLLQNTALKVYPNPAKGVFTISLNTISKADVAIYNTLGKVVYRGSMSNGSLQITNNRQFAQGLYMVKAISSDNKIYHSKLIIR